MSASKYGSERSFAIFDARQAISETRIRRDDLETWLREAFADGRAVGRDEGAAEERERRYGLEDVDEGEERT